MFHLIYVSSAVEPMNARDLADLLEQSREKNARLNLTGMLLYLKQSFMQVLEGDEQAVCDLYETIRQDKRHTDVTLLVSEENSARDFETWTMGFQNLDDLDPADLPGWTDFLDQPFASRHWADSQAHDLLLTFRRFT